SSHNLRASVTHQAREAQDFAAFKLEVHIFDRMALIPEVPDAQDDFLIRIMVPVRELVIKVPPDHRTHDFAIVRLGSLLVQHAFTIAQHSDLIGDPRNLLHPVGDVDDGHAARPQVLDDAKEHVDLGIRKRRSGLIHDEHLRIHHQGLCDLDHLLLADGAVARPTVQIDPELQPFEDLFGLTPHEAHIEQAEFRMFIADEEVLQHRQLRPDVELLMDEHDPRFFSFLEIRVIHLRPVPHNLAPVIRMDTREYFHQRRFAGAVLAHERMDRRIPEYEIHTEEHFVGPERLVYIFHFNH